jgi:hypothetical protein
MGAHIAGAEVSFDLIIGAQVLRQWPEFRAKAARPTLRQRVSPPSVLLARRQRC